MIRTGWILEQRKRSSAGICLQFLLNSQTSAWILVATMCLELLPLAKPVDKITSRCEILSCCSQHLAT